MKKIPTLFERIFDGHRIVGITDKVYPGMEWVLNGEGVATIKLDGSCCALIGGKLYKRYDAKNGKKPPEGAIPCCDPDPITGHHPHWVEVSENNPGDKWFVAAFNNMHIDDGMDRTYEAIGPHFQGNPHRLQEDVLVPHGYHDVVDIYLKRSFVGIKEYLADNDVEGLVFWKDGEPMCKIKRSDFGFKWPLNF